VVKFGLYAVNNGTHKARVQYSLDGHISGRPCVTVRCKDYGHALEKIFSDAVNHSDGMTDYFETSKVRLFPEHPLYPAARQAAERIRTKRGW
jgi:hypothetical protein